MDNSRRTFFQIALSFFALYVFFVVQTPGSIFNVRSPIWVTARISVFIFWLALIYFVRVRDKATWSRKNFVLGFIVGGGAISVFWAVVFLEGLFAGPQFWYPSLNRELALVATFIFYGILSGLWSAHANSRLRAFLGSLLFWLLQLVLDVTVHGSYFYIT